MVLIAAQLVACTVTEPVVDHARPAFFLMEPGGWNRFSYGPHRIRMTYEINVENVGGQPRRPPCQVWSEGHEVVTSRTDPLVRPDQTGVVRGSSTFPPDASFDTLEDVEIDCASD